jgi:hypothetical protein
MMSRTISPVALTKPLGEPDHNRFTALFLSLFDHARNLSRGGNTNGAINTDDKNSAVGRRVRARRGSGYRKTEDKNSKRCQSS